LGLALLVAHVNHRLRMEADEDAAFVAEVARTWHLPFFDTVLDPAPLRTDPHGLEAAARAARYAFLAATARRVTPPTRIPIVAVAHHADDQAETVLLRLVQGTGLRGLGAMRPAVEPDADPSARPVRLVRPLLELRRADLLAYAAANDLAWREDPSNLDHGHLRNHIRHVLLPALRTVNPQVVAGLTRTANLLADDAARLAALDRQLLAELTGQPLADAPAERVVIDLARWPTLGVSERRGVLRAGLDCLHTDLRDIGFAHIEALLEHLAGPVPNSGPHPLAAGLCWSTTGATAAGHARLSLHRCNCLPFVPTTPWLPDAWRAAVGTVPLPPTGAVNILGWELQSFVLPVAALPATWRKNLDPWTAFLDADCVGAGRLTTPQPRQACAPLGMAGQHRQIGDLFTDEKIHSTLRAGWPLVVDQATGEVLWVCGIRVGHQARVTPATTRVWRLSWRRLAGPSAADEVKRGG
jgi:tRNA(Ile)-lysidine synthase